MTAHTIWERMGSEDEAADRTAVHALVDAISDEDLRSALAGHHEADLATVPEEEREAALDALVRGYRRGA